MLRAAILTLFAATAWAQATDPSALETSEVTFTIDAQTASKVSVVGDFNGWDTMRTPLCKGDGGTWKVRTDLRKGKVYDYCFVVDGHWVLDPKNPLRSADGKLSVMEVPGGKQDDTVNGAGVDTLRMMLKRMDEKISCFGDEVAALRKAVAEQADTIAKKDAQIDLIRKDLDDARIEKTTMTKELTEAKIHLDEVSQRYATLKAECEKGTGDSEKTTKKVAELQKQASELQGKMNAVLQDKRAAEEKASKAEADLKALNDKYMALAKKQEEGGPASEDAVPHDEAGATNDKAAHDTAPHDNAGHDNASSEGHDLKPLAATKGVAEAADKAGAKDGKKEGKVLVVGATSHTLMISLGKKNGVKEGDQFYILHDGKVIARAKLDRPNMISEEFCNVTVDGDAKMDQIAADDVVTNLAK